MRCLMPRDRKVLQKFAQLKSLFFPPHCGTQLEGRQTLAGNTRNCQIRELRHGLWPQPCCSVAFIAGAFDHRSPSRGLSNLLPKCSLQSHCTPSYLVSVRTNTIETPDTNLGSRKSSTLEGCAKSPFADPIGFFTSSSLGKPNYLPWPVPLGLN